MDYLLRTWREEDAASISVLANNKKIADCLRDAFPYPYTYSDALDFINNSMEQSRSHAMFLAIEISEKAVGSIAVIQKDDVYRCSAEIGYWLAEPYWGKGIMASVIKQVCDAFFRAHKDVVRIFAEPFAQNVASQRVLEKAGFVREAVLKNSIIKNDVIDDSMVYALYRNA